MNERIKQLRKEAWAFVTHDLETVERDHVVTYSEHLEMHYAKFAELLVLECINSVMDGTKEGDHYAMRIEQHFDNGPGGILHFGVKE